MRLHWCFATLLSAAIITSTTKASHSPIRWSRQISSRADNSDWVPVATVPVRETEQPTKRQAVAQPRILAEPVTFGRSPVPLDGRLQTSDNRLLYLQSAPPASHNYLNEQPGFNQVSFGPQSYRVQPQAPQFPMGQHYRPEPPKHEKKMQKPPAATNYVPFLKHVPPSAIGMSRPFTTLPKSLRQESPKFVDGYRVENRSYDASHFAKRPQSLQKMKFNENSNYNQRKELISEMVPPPKPHIEKEEVQLLYVPIESFKGGQINFRQPGSSKKLSPIAQFGSAALLTPNFQMQPFQSSYNLPTFQELYRERLPNPFEGKEGFSNIPNYQFASSSTESPTQKPSTAKPKKLKPHQPPLAVFVTKDSGKPETIKVADVLSTLKNAQTVAVLDSVSPSNSPKVFIGPSALRPPQNYVKFEIPYLSNIQDSERRIRQLPFFVAPLSYNTPAGFSKIPFPSPHVGSVIVNGNMNEGLTTFDPSPRPEVIPNAFTADTYNQQSNTPTTKPTFSYFSTVPSRLPPSTITEKPFSNYFSFEPQTVTSLKTTEQDLVTATPFFGSPENSQYHLYSNTPTNERDIFRSTQKPLSYPTEAEILRSTQRPPATIPSRLLETHNPFSINQAFEFSSPMDNIPSQPGDISQQDYNTTPIPKENTLSNTQPERVKPAAPEYYQGYTPEIQYQSEISGSRYPDYTSNTFQQQQEASSQSPPKEEISQPGTEPHNSDDAQNLEIQSVISSFLDESIQPEAPKEKSTTTSTTSTTTTRRTPVRRTRPRVTTQKPDAADTTSKQTFTRRPLRERKPTTTTIRPRYEGARTTERSTRKQPESETASTETTPTTRNVRTKTRGRLQFKPSEEQSDIKETKSKKAENDLAYQRDVLHQNYPVTLQERMSTVDIEAITTPLPQAPHSSIQNRQEYSSEEEQAVPIQNQSRYSEETNEPITSAPARPSVSFDPQHTVAITQSSPQDYSRFSSREKFEVVSSPVSTYPTTRQSSRYSSSETSSHDDAFTSAPRQGSTSYPSRYETRDKDEVAITSAPRFSSTRFTSREKPESPSEEVFTNVRPIARYPSQQQDSIQTSDENVENTSSKFSSTENVERPSSKIPPNDYSEFTNANSNDYTADKSSQLPYRTTPKKEASQESLPKNKEEVAFEENISFDVQKANKAENVVDTGSDVSASFEDKTQSKYDDPEPITTVASSTMRNRISLRTRPSRLTTTTTEDSVEVTQRTTMRRPIRPVTYRPSFSGRRTTMRIDEIGSEFKTKQINSRVETKPDIDHRPVYKPELTTEPSSTSVTADTTRRTPPVYKRRRPPYTTSTTEASATSKKPYETARARYRTRTTTTTAASLQPQADEPTQTTVKPNYNKYRSRIPGDRFRSRTTSTTEAPTQDDDEEADQDANFTILSQKFVPLDYEWNDPEKHVNRFKPIPQSNRILGDEKIDYSHERDFSNNNDIITANYEDVLITVTPASNKLNAAETTADNTPTPAEDGKEVSSFEDVIEEVMKNLEEQDEDEYSGEYTLRKKEHVEKEQANDIITAPTSYDLTSVSTTQKTYESSPEPSKDSKGQKKRGFWRKVRVRPSTTESIDVAESQFYSNTVNHLGDTVKPSQLNKRKETYQTTEKVYADETQRTTLEDSDTTYPTTQSEEIVESSSEAATPMKATTYHPAPVMKEVEETSTEEPKQTINPADLDLGTGSPDPIVMEKLYSDEDSAEKDSNVFDEGLKTLDSVMSYILGNDETTTQEPLEQPQEFTVRSVVTEISKSRNVPTEASSYFPEEITNSSPDDEDLIAQEMIEEQMRGIKKISDRIALRNSTEKVSVTAPPETSRTEISSSMVEEEIKTVEPQTTTTQSVALDDPFRNMKSITSMTSEVSEETEICFRGKCFKTRNPLF